MENDNDNNGTTLREPLLERRPKKDHEPPLRAARRSEKEEEEDEVDDVEHGKTDNGAFLRSRSRGGGGGRGVETSTTTIDHHANDHGLLSSAGNNGNNGRDANDDDDDDENETSSSSSHAEPPTSNVFSATAEWTVMANLAWPLAVSFFCRMGMASTDSAFVGHIHDQHRSPETYLAAAVLSDLVVNCLITPPLAFNQVLNALVAQAIGSGHPKTAGIWLQQSMFWLAIAMLPLLYGFFHVEKILLYLDFPADVSYLAGTYAKYNIIWPIPNGWYQCLRFYFQAQGLARPAMYNNLLFFGINMGLNYFFIFQCRLGFIGAAISLTVSRSLQPVLYYFYMFVWKQHHRTTWPGWSWRHHSRDRTCQFLTQSLPNVGTLLLQQVAGQATTVLVAKLGTNNIAISSALGAVMTPLAGTISATSWTVTSCRVGYHLGRGDAIAARKCAMYVIGAITVATTIAGALAYHGRRTVLAVATDDTSLINGAVKCLPALLVGTYLSLIVGNITSGVFSGLGRPVLATILSLGFELPLSIAGVAVYIIHFRGTLLGVYWLQAALSFVECIVVTIILMTVDWQKCAEEVRRRQQQDDEPLANHTITTTTLGGGGEQHQQREADGQVEEEDDDDVDTLLVPLISNNGHHASAAVAVLAELADDPEDPRK